MTSPTAVSVSGAATCSSCLAVLLSASRIALWLIHDYDYPCLSRSTERTFSDRCHLARPGRPGRLVPRRLRDAGPALGLLPAAARDRSAAAHHVGHVAGGPVRRLPERAQGRPVQPAGGGPADQPPAPGPRRRPVHPPPPVRGRHQP